MYCQQRMCCWITLCCWTRHDTCFLLQHTPRLVNVGCNGICVFCAFGFLIGIVIQMAIGCFSMGHTTSFSVTMRVRLNIGHGGFILFCVGQIGAVLAQQGVVRVQFLVVPRGSTFTLSRRFQIEQLTPKGILLPAETVLTDPGELYRVQSLDYIMELCFSEAATKASVQVTRRPNYDFYLISCLLPRVFAAGCPG